MSWINCYLVDVIHKKVSSEAKVIETPTVESVVAESTTIINLITSLRAKASALIKDLPLKNATQREYALTVALTDEAFATEFLQLPEKFKETVIQ